MAGDVDARGAGADDRDLDLGDVLLDDLEGVDQAGHRDAGRALLVVVPDRDLALRAQLVEDPEALGLGDVLEVEAAEGRLEGPADLDDLVRVLFVEADGEGVDAAQVLVEDPLAFHDRQAGLGADVAQAEDARAVADDGHGIPLVGVLVGLLLVGVDLLADRGDAGRVPDREIVEIADPALQGRAHLALVELVEPRGIQGRLLGLGQQLFDGDFLHERTSSKIRSLIIKTRPRKVNHFRARRRGRRRAACRRGAGGRTGSRDRG